MCVNIYIYIYIYEYIYIYIYIYVCYEYIYIYIYMFVYVCMCVCVCVCTLSYLCTYSRNARDLLHACLYEHTHNTQREREREREGGREGGRERLKHTYTHAHTHKPMRCTKHFSSALKHAKTLNSSAHAHTFVTWLRGHLHRIHTYTHIYHEHTSAGGTRTYAGIQQQCQ